MKVQNDRGLGPCGKAVFLVLALVYSPLHAQVERPGWPEVPPLGPVKVMTVTTLSPDSEVLSKVVKEWGRDGKLLTTTYYGYGGDLRGKSQEVYSPQGLRVSTLTSFPTYGQNLTTVYRSDAQGNLTEAVESYKEGDVVSHFVWTWFRPGVLKSLKVLRPDGEHFFTLEYQMGAKGLRETYTYNSATSGEGGGKLTYNSRGLLEGEPYFNADGGLGFLRYTYDPQDRVNREDLQSSQGEPDGWIEYLRDNRGNWVESRQYVPGPYLIQTRKVQIEYWP